MTRTVVNSREARLAGIVITTARGLRRLGKELDYLVSELRASLELGATGTRREVETILIDLEYLAGDIDAEADMIGMDDEGEDDDAG